MMYRFILRYSVNDKEKNSTLSCVKRSALAMCASYFNSHIYYYRMKMLRVIDQFVILDIESRKGDRRSKESNDECLRTNLASDSMLVSNFVS